MLWVITNKKGALSSIFQNLFIHSPLLMKMMFMGRSLESVVSQRPVFGPLVRFPRPHSRMFPYSRSLMIVLRRSLYGVVPDGQVYGLLVPLPQPVLIGFTQEANISLEAGFLQIFLSMYVGFHSR